MPTKLDEHRNRWKNSSSIKTIGSPLGSPGIWGLTSMSHAVTGLLSFFAAEPSPQSHSLSSSPQENRMNESNEIYYPRHRNTPLFQPPPLYPISLCSPNHSSQDSTRLLTKYLAEEIRLLVPPRLQLCEEWNLIYNLEEDGVSLTTLYKKCSELRGSPNGFVLIVRDGRGDLFGAYLNEAPRIESHFYGNGECFLWRASFLSTSQLNLPMLLSTDTKDRQNTPIDCQDLLSAVPSSLNRLEPTKSNTSSLSSERIRFKAFPYSGINEYFMLCESGYLSVGGGDGHYGLWLDDTFERGISSHCQTFGNEPLSEEGEKFDIMGVEVWSVGDISLSQTN